MTIKNNTNHRKRTKMIANGKKEIPQTLVQAYKSHVPMHIVNDYLKFHNKPTARSWDELFAKNSEEKEFFASLLTEIICFGKKSIFAFNVNEIDLSPLDKAELSSLDLQQALKKETAHYTLFQRGGDGRFSYYTFICRKPAYETYVLTKNDLTADAIANFWSPESEIKLKKKMMVTVFDSIIYDSRDKTLFIIIDNLRFAFEQTAFETQSQLRNELQQVCPTLATLTPIDFFPCVEGMYKKSSEGIVHRLAFECNTAAVRDEKLKQGQLDLRNEKYHISGKAAIGNGISPYKIGITWHPSAYKQLATEIDFEISGTRRDLHHNSGIYTCQVNSEVTLNELVFALNRVILYV